MTEQPSEGAIEVRDNVAEQRYEITVDGEVAGLAAYQDSPRQRVFTHTEIRAQYEGQGLGSRLAAGALDDARARGLAVLPLCPFIARYVREHPEYADLIAARR